MRRLVWRPSRRKSRWGTTILAAGLWLGGCGREPGGEAGPYRLHPSDAAPPLPSVSPSARASPPPETGTPAPYPYPTPELPEPEPFEVVGMVLLRGEPAAGIRVSVVNDRTFENVGVTTDAEGIYRAANLAAGAYFVHYYNDRDNFKVGYWKTRARPVSAAFGARHPAFDLYLVGMQNAPGMGAAIALPERFTWEPYGLVLRYRFRIHDRGGPSGRPYYVSPWLDPAVTSYTYDGQVNQTGMGQGPLTPGRYLWGVYWDAGLAGEGGNLYQDFVVRPGSPTGNPPGGAPAATASAAPSVERDAEEPEAG